MSRGKLLVHSAKQIVQLVNNYAAVLAGEDINKRLAVLESTDENLSIVIDWKVVQNTLCSRCCEALGSQKHAANSSFLKLKGRGGLFKPTQSVIKICEVTEQRFQRMRAFTNGKLPQGIPDAISTSVLSELNLSAVFRELEDHMVQTAVNENHIFGLIKQTTKIYCKIRLYHLGKENIQSITGEKVRKKLT